MKYIVIAKDENIFWYLKKTIDQGKHWSGVRKNAMLFNKQQADDQLRKCKVEYEILHFTFYIEPCGEINKDMYMDYDRAMRVI